MKPQIQEPPHGLLRFIVVIPAYLETELIDCLEALKATEKVNTTIEVITVVNFSESDTQINKDNNYRIFEDTRKWCITNSTTELKFHSLLSADLPQKHAGAGLARKIGMDEALYRFGLVDEPSGFILSLDADTRVDVHYFTSLESNLKQKTGAGGCIYYFEHPISGTKFSPEVYEAVLEYELHMRYYKHAIDDAGFPWSNYTIGSCFGVRADFYARQGGMNRHKAGEDFYFLHKCFPNITFIEVTGTCVRPSSRISERVPFGTGPAIKKIVEGESFRTYSPDAIKNLKELFLSVDSLFNLSVEEINKHVSKLDKTLVRFLNHQQFTNRLIEIKSNTATPEAFTKRFFRWFDAFKIVKYLNSVHETCYKKPTVKNAVEEWLFNLGIKTQSASVADHLKFFRELDQAGKSIRELKS